jgi:hypothetical protein
MISDDQPLTVKIERRSPPKGTGLSLFVVICQGEVDSVHQN